MIVAEDITSRFLNVIQLFNGNIPLVALKMTAFKVGDAVALTFVKVLDEMSRGLDEDDELPGDPANRASWVAKASELTLKIADELLTLVNAKHDRAGSFGGER